MAANDAISSWRVWMNSSLSPTSWKAPISPLMPSPGIPVDALDAPLGEAVQDELGSVRHEVSFGVGSAGSATRADPAAPHGGRFPSALKRNCKALPDHRPYSVKSVVSDATRLSSRRRRAMNRPPAETCLFVSHAAWGVLLLTAPTRALRLRGPSDTRSVRMTARILGGRHAAEATLIVATGPGRPPRWATTIDALHAGTMLLVAGVSSRLQRGALISAAVSASLAAFADHLRQPRR